MTFPLVLAYLFAAGTGVTMVYLARQNRKQGWQRPAPRWFGVELGTQRAAMPATAATESDAGDLLPELLQLNRQLAALGTTNRPEVESSKAESAETAELVGSRKV